MTLLPLVWTPLPQLELYGSVDCGGPYLETEKLPRFERLGPSLAAQSKRLRVTLGWAPPAAA